MHIDWWTIALQAVNFILLAWLLQHFLYRPVMGMIARRQEATNRLLDDAKTAKAHARSVERELAGQHARIAAERQQALAQAHAAGEADRKALLDKAAIEADRVAAERRQALEREHEEAARSLTDAATRLAVAIARRLLATLPLDIAEEAFLNRAWHALDALPSEKRRAFENQPGGMVRMVTATTLSDPAQSRGRARLGEILGHQTAVEFAVDPALIAGVELHSGAAVLRLSWAEDLAQIVEELASHDQPLARAR